MARIDDIQEIVDLIVDHLVHDIRRGTYSQYRPIYPISINLRELKQYSLISKAFASHSRRYLFSTIALYAKKLPPTHIIPETERTSPDPEPALDEASSRAADSLLSIFGQKPHLIKHLRTMYICHQFAFLLRRYESLRKLLDLSRSQGNPREVELYGSRGSESYEWGKCVPSNYGFQEMIGAHIQTLSCRYADVVPVSFIAKNHELQTLRLISCSGSETQIDGRLNPSSAASPRPRPKRLFLDNSWNVFNSLLGIKSTGQPAVDFSNLIYVSVCVMNSSNEDALCFKCLLSVAVPSLEVLNMFTYTHGV